jgi:hypothetical protein
MKFMSMLYRSMVGAFGFLALSLTLPTAGHAVLFDLTSEHCSGCGTGPFGTVDVTQVGANLQVRVDLADGISWAQIAQTDLQLFKFNVSLASLSDIFVFHSFPGLQIVLANTGAFDGDGTGSFNFGISCITCGPGSLGITSDIEFSIANATITDVTGFNNLGNIFAAGIFSSQTGNTGVVDVSGQCLLGLCPPSGPIASVPGPIVGAGIPCSVWEGSTGVGGRRLFDLSGH